LLLKGDNLSLRSSGNESYVTGVANGAVSVYHNNIEKLTTTATGVNVTMTSIGDGVDLIDTHTAHGITDYLPTNVSLRLSQQNATEGGGRIIGATDNTGQHALSFYGLSQDSPVATVNNFNFIGAAKDGTAIGDVPAAKQVLQVKNNATALFTIMGDGKAKSQFTAACWCCFDGQNTISIRDSHNVASISDNGTADYTVNIATDMANRNYAVVGSAGRDGSTTFSYNYGVTFSSKNAGDIRLRVRTSESTGVDVDENMIVIFGDQ